MRSCFAVSSTNITDSLPFDGVKHPTRKMIEVRKAVMRLRKELAGQRRRCLSETLTDLFGEVHKWSR